jgi:hypothetical protein
MRLEEIQAEWDVDCEIDKTQLGNEAIAISRLQSKYLKIMTREILQLKAMEENLKILRLDKWEFLTQGPTPETPPDWRLPPKGGVLKTEVSMYLDADRDIIAENLKIVKQREKANFVKSIIDSLNGRSWNIRAAIDWEKFRAGGY